MGQSAPLPEVPAMFSGCFLDFEDDVRLLPEANACAGWALVVRADRRPRPPGWRAEIVTSPESGDPGGDGKWALAEPLACGKWSGRAPLRGDGRCRRIH
ncbi:hypothetical protein GCM10009680_07790 [Streptomyces yatensis]|uniref:Uncharacterized protein n=1 Tax=Streptomyces yatensis TaxID=155177 RepID=A0ABN2GFJ8_9ACTN